MQHTTFCQLIERLTGTPVKEVQDQERMLLDRILENDQRAIDRTQFNELLLLVNKDRVEEPFFDFFFREHLEVGQLAGAVKRFQKVAMLRYGNFIFAYRTLSRLHSRPEFDNELGELLMGSETDAQEFLTRPKKLLNTEPIAREDTPLVGYLLAPQIIAEAERGRLLLTAIEMVDEEKLSSWEDLEGAVRLLAQAGQRPAVWNIANNFHARYPRATVRDLGDYLKGVIPQLEQRRSDVERIQTIGTRNQDVYLTWDHMDVYFATSMRKAWEYADLYDFVSALMSSSEFADLDIRYFDPTQSYTDNRIDKGLVESLMLKRARCTVYSVQDTDTLGKDSELAATLAQGKPVIAYVPMLDEPARATQLLAEDPLSMLERLRFVLYADERFQADLPAADMEFVSQFHTLTDFAQTTVFRSIRDVESTDDFRIKHGAELERLCRIIAWSEKRIYDKRADTLKRFHPLAIQINLATGVANGVLVVRKVEDCAKLLRRILTRSMEFDLEEDGRMWYLQERISGSIFRVVTKNRKLDNCFWNF